MIGKADTVGVSKLNRARDEPCAHEAQCFYDLVIEVALIRRPPYKVAWFILILDADKD